MAQKKPPFTSPVEPPQEEMTVVVFKFKGGAESMQKGFDAVNNAIAALGPANTGNQRVIAHRQPAQLTAPSANGTIVDPETQDITDEHEAEEPAEETPVPVNGKTKKASAPKYAFMNDLILAPTGAMSWNDYATEYKPQTVDEKFLVASAWLQTQGGQETFGGSHLFTCFRAMNWKAQVDMTQPLRKLKSEKSWHENPEFGKWKLTGIGLTAAEKVGKE